MPLKPKRIKKCVVCHTQFRPFKTTQRVCSHACAVIFAKEKTQKQKEDLNRLRNERVEMDKLSKMTFRTEAIVHEYIRLRDRGKPCISCGTFWRKDFQAGHRFNKKNYHGIRFDLDNIHGQCPYCNEKLKGNYDWYDIRLPERIGQEKYLALKKRATIALRVPHTFTRYELKEIQDRCKRYIKELKMKE